MRPKFTITEDRGDVCITVRAALTPDEARAFARAVLGYAARADAFRIGIIAEIVDTAPILDHERCDLNMPPH